MSTQQDTSSGGEGVDSTTPTVDFGYQGSVPRSAAHLDAKPGFLDPDENIPSESPDRIVSAKTARLTRKR
jgi:hypothetical protein